MKQGRRRKAEPLTEREWDRVFKLRCQSKRGARLHEEDMAFLCRAHGEDPGRYNALDREVRRATAPFGAVLRDDPEDPAAGAP